MRTLARILLLLSCLTPAALAAGETSSTLRGAWSDEILELAESLPVQDGGRVKPLHTYASFSLLRLNGKRSVKLADGSKLSAMAWFLDTLFFPREAADYPVFLVRDSAALDAIGVPHADKKKSDRYSFNELRQGIEKLYELARQYGAIDAKERTSVQQAVYLLAGNVDSYVQLLGHMDFARYPISLGEGERLSALFGGGEVACFHELLAKSDELSSLFQELRADPGAADEVQDLGLAIRAASDLAASTPSLALIPPDAPRDEKEEWYTPADLLDVAFTDDGLSERHLAILGHFEALHQKREDPEAFRSELEALHGTATGMAKARGEYEKVPLELTYYKSKVISYSLYAFIAAFLAMAFMWLMPKAKAFTAGTWLLVLGGAGFLTTAIVMRCVIRDRPPVSTLYETLLFVTAVGAITGLVVEAINRQRLALSAAAILGMVGMFLANGYETLDKQDTMPSLVAVLDTNFWLATHVTAITTGYSAGMFASLLASIYLVAKAFGFRRGDTKFYKSLARMSYGVLAFALIFSLVGTILGGIWANYSWGRFWGWDPKENGALLIVISQVAILHARMGGYLREHGLQMATAFAGTIIAFSWFGVNLLGVGLHSYGFTSGISQALWTYYSIQWGIVGLGGLTLLMNRSRSA